MKQTFSRRMLAMLLIVLLFVLTSCSWGWWQRNDPFGKPYPTPTINWDITVETLQVGAPTADLAPVLTMIAQ